MNLAEIFSTEVKKVTDNRYIMERLLLFDVYQKRYSLNTFRNNAIVFIEVEGQYIWTIVLEFGKLHPTSQNHVGIKMGSRAYKILEKVAPKKIGRLEPAKCLHKQEEFLYGVHITGVRRMRIKRNGLEDTAELIENASKEEREVVLDNKTVFMGYGMLEALSRNEDCVITVKDNGDNYSNFYRQGYGTTSIENVYREIAEKEIEEIRALRH